MGVVSTAGLWAWFQQLVCGRGFGGADSEGRVFCGRGFERVVLEFHFCGRGSVGTFCVRGFVGSDLWT